MEQVQLPPAIECVVEAYKLRLFEDPRFPLDSFLDEVVADKSHADVTLRTGDRSLLLRRLLEEERGAADANCVPFDRYWSRPWFDAHIHDVVAVLLADRFEVIRPIGSGGQGLVYLVKNLKVGRQEALKIFHLKNQRDMSEAEVKEWRERFSRESKASDSLHRKDSGIRGPRDLTTRRNNEETARNHNVPIVYEVNQLNGIHYFTMQYIDGVTLRELLEKTKGPIAPRLAATWMRTVARTLALLHATGHIHRDVKPGNLMVDTAGTLYLVDFGLVKVISEGLPDLTQAGGIGTPNYMAREQLVDARNVSPKADVYSLGATFYHVLTGQIWQGNATWPKQVPKVLRELCTACLAQDPDKRPTASEAEKKLHRWLYGISRRQILAVGAVAFVGAAGAAWRWGVPKSASVIRTEARGLRNEYVAQLLGPRRIDPKAGTPYFLFTKEGSSTPEVTAAAQATYALLSMPEFSAGQAPWSDGHLVGNLIDNLAAPFPQIPPGGRLQDAVYPQEPYWLMRHDQEHRDLGWVYNVAPNQSPKPTAEAILWMTIAHARVLRCWGDRPDLFGETPNATGLHDNYDKLVNMLKAYATPGKPGAWNRYANQKNPLESSSATSGIALLALLEAHLAKLRWFAADGVDDDPVNWIAKTVEHLGERFALGDPLPEEEPVKKGHAAMDPAAGSCSRAPRAARSVGWYCNHGQSGDCGDWELSLMIHTVLLRTAAANVVPLPGDAAALRRHLLSLLFRSEYNVATKFAPKKSVRADVVLDREKLNLSPKEAENRLQPVVATEPLNLMWYPWALAAAAEALAHPALLGLSSIDRTRIQLSLGGWTGNIGAEVKDHIFAERETSCVAESLMGLSCVEALPG